jgi:hypothetical protein
VKLPRDLSGDSFAQALERLDYRFDHRESSHQRYCTERDGHFCITIPDKNPLRLGTLNNLLRLVADHHGLSRPELLQRLFG